MTAVLSIVIPAYNEERYIGTLLDRILAVDLTALGVEKEIIVVNDGSCDRTAEIVRRYGSRGIRLGDEAVNRGKGAAVRVGIAMATGTYLLIQDGDLEYDPGDYVPMLRALTDTGAEAVYGSRYLPPAGTGAVRALVTGRHPNQSWSAYLGGRSLSVVARLCTGTYLSDTVTALKLFRLEVLKALPLETTGFELDHEISARLLARGCRIVEVPIRYYPRSRAEGKKIGLRDWVKAVRTFSRYRHG